MHLDHRSIPRRLTALAALGALALSAVPAQAQEAEAPETEDRPSFIDEIEVPSAVKDLIEGRRPRAYEGGSSGS